jgi:transcriptional regulator with XRE-family HTH domain
MAFLNSERSEELVERCPILAYDIIPVGHTLDCVKWYGMNTFTHMNGAPNFEARLSDSLDGGVNMSLGSKLKELRIRHNKSLQQVADAIGASKAHIWDLERGESKNPSLELTLKLAKLFKVSVADLVGENPHSQDAPELAALYRELKDLSPGDRETIHMLTQRLNAVREKDKK